MESNLGDYLKSIRGARTKSQRRVHELAGISQWRLSRIENGDSIPTFPELCLLARTLCFSLDGLRHCLETGVLDLGRCLLPYPPPE